MDYYLWSKPQNKPPFTQEANKRRPPPLWAAAWQPRALELATQGRARAGRSDPRFQEVAWPGNPDLPCDSAQGSPQGGALQGKPSLKANK